jgi:hypothetical protein
MPRTKGASTITPEAKAFVARVERMLKKADPDTGTLERLACRLLTHPAREALETKFFADKGIVTDHRDVINWQARLKAAEISANIWRVLMQYKHGMPTQPIEANLTIGYTEALQKMRSKRGQ